MNKYQSLSLLLSGIVIGMGYSLACSSSGDGGGSVMPNIPGVGVAMAQAGGCSQWEAVSVPAAGMASAGEVLSPSGETSYDIRSVPAGWTPLGQDGSSDDSLWLVRCAP